MQPQSEHRHEIWNVKGKSQPNAFAAVRMHRQPEAIELVGAVYTSIRTYDRDSGTPKYLQIHKHISRLHESLTIEHGDLAFDDGLLRHSITQVVNLSAIPGELRIKIVIAPKRSDPIIMLIEPLTTPDAADYERGVRVYTTAYIRKDPKAKVFEFVEIQDQIRGQFGERVEEVIMLDPSGGMLEGLSSNFFAVIGEAIHTAGRGVLNGITRQIVIDIARNAGVPLVFQKPNIKQIEEISECFITSTSRGVLPVVSIDHKTIGPGKPGPITLNVQRLFEEKIPKLIKPL